MNRLIAAIDASQVSESVLAVTVELASLWDATIVAVHVGDGDGPDVRASARSAGVRLESSSGDVVERLLEYEREDAVVAVVVGARGRSGGPRPAGHIAEQLLRRCTKPIVVVPPGLDERWRLRRLVVALEGDAAYSAMLAPLFDWAQEHDLEIVAVHVLDELHLPRFADQASYERDAFASEFVARHAPEPRADVRFELRVGIPAEQVLSVAGGIDADLIAVAWSRHLEPGRARFVTHVLDRAQVPLLLLPAP